MKMSEDERQCLSESRGGSANVISIFSYCARRYLFSTALMINFTFYLIVPISKPKKLVIGKNSKK